MARYSNYLKKFIKLLLPTSPSGAGHRSLIQYTSNFSRVLEIAMHWNEVRMKMSMPHTTRDVVIKPDEECFYYLTAGQTLKV